MYFAVCPWGFSSQIKLFCFAVLYAKQKGERLRIYQKNNCISHRFTFFEALYTNEHGSEFVSEPVEDEPDIFQLKAEAPVQSVLKEYYSTVSYTPQTNLEQLRSDVKQILSYRPAILKQIESVYRTVVNADGANADGANADGAYDIGVHVRTGDKITTGEMKPVALTEYFNAIETELRRIGKCTADKHPTIFLMTDNCAVYEEFKTKATEKGWDIYACKSTTERVPHIQSEFNDTLPSKKLKSLYEFLAEIEIMTRCQTIVCTLSSNVGLLASLLHKHSHANIISLDLPNEIATYFR